MNINFQQIADASTDPELLAQILPVENSANRNEFLNALVQCGCSEEVFFKACQIRKSMDARDGDGDGFIYDGTDHEQAVADVPDGVNPKVLDWAYRKWGSKTAPDGSSVAENFAKWFGQSKIVDPDGNPLLCYHGTDAPDAFNEFDPKISTAVYRHKGQELPVVDYWDVGEDGTNEPEKFINHAMVDVASLGSAKRAYEFRAKEQAPYGEPTGKTKRIIDDLKRLADMGVEKLDQTYEKRPSGDGSWFTPNLGYNFIDQLVAEHGGRVYPVYLKIENPKFVSIGEVESAGRLHRISDYKKDGYDGVVGLGKPSSKDMAEWGWDGATQIVAFDSSQVKSAIGNDGGFTDSKDITKAIRDGDGDGLIYDGTPEERQVDSGRPFVDTKEFKEWFGDSKVVNADGSPMVVYHGSATTNIEQFLPNGGKDGYEKVIEQFLRTKEKNEQFGYMNFRSGTFFSPDPEYAGNYTGENGGVLYPVYVRAENPIIISNTTSENGGYKTEYSMPDRNKTADAMFIVNNGKLEEIAVIDPTQVKSAISNSGKFDRSSRFIGKSLTFAKDGDGDGKIYDGTDKEQAVEPEGSFEKWFEGSKIVGRDGKPLVVYHGTRSNITEFKPADGSKPGDRGFYFTPDPEYASGYATSFSDNPDRKIMVDGEVQLAKERANVMPLFLSIKNPAFVLTKPRSPKGTFDYVQMSLLKQAGHDGMIVGVTEYEYSMGYKAVEDADEIVAFSPSQIKSAIANEGTYDPDSKDIRKSIDARDGDGDGLINDGTPQERPVSKSTEVNPVVLKWAQQKFGPEKGANFAKWFGASKMVDESGVPKVFYHGSPESFESFATDVDLGVARDRAAFFSDNPEVASGYAYSQSLAEKKLIKEENDLIEQLDSLKRDADLSSVSDRVLLNAMNDKLDSGELSREEYDRMSEVMDRLWDIQNDETEHEDTTTPSVYPVYLKIENPHEFEAKDISWDYIVPYALSATNRSVNDGLVFKNIMDNPSEYSNSGPSMTVAIFNANQVKSAIGNEGTFDPSDKRIRKSLDPRDGDGDGFINDGKESERPASNVTESEQFKNWFGKSKVVDAAGSPMVVYHGTSRRFEEFSSRAEANTFGPGFYGEGFYFTDSPRTARQYGNVVMPVYLKMENPYDFRKKSTRDFARDFPDLEIYSQLTGTTEKIGDILDKEDSIRGKISDIQIAPEENGTRQIIYRFDGKWQVGGNLTQQQLDRGDDPMSVILPYQLRRNKVDNLDSLAHLGQEFNVAKVLEEAGYDGAIGWGTNLVDSHTSEYVVFKPNQIKSAVGNSDFSHYSDNIYKSMVAKDGDGDGKIFDGTPQERSVEQKPKTQLITKLDLWAHEKFGENAQNFVDWFGDSKIVDSDGIPLVVYHGTNKEFDSFDPGRIGQNTGNEGHQGYGLYFSFEKGEAETYGDKIIEAYVSMQNPFVLNADSAEVLRDNGVDWIDEKSDFSIDYDSLLVAVEKRDPVAADLLRLLKDHGDDAWDIFFEKHPGWKDHNGIDLNDVRGLFDMTQKVESSDYNDPLPYYAREQLSNYGLDGVKIKTAFHHAPTMHWITDLGNRAKEVTEVIKKLGHDGIIVGSEIVAFDPSQIKSVNNSGSFNRKSPNIYKHHLWCSASPRTPIHGRGCACKSIAKSLASAPVDGDGDGFVYDGTSQEQPLWIEAASEVERVLREKGISMKRKIDSEDMLRWIINEGFGEEFFEGDEVASEAIAKLPWKDSERSSKRFFSNKKLRTKAFEKWFGDSKVVDDKGEPLVVYHGTKADFSEFSHQFLSGDNRTDMLGHFFSNKPEVAGRFAGDDGSVKPVYLSIQNPFVFDMDSKNYINTPSGKAVASVTDKEPFVQLRKFILNHAQRVRGKSEVSSWKDVTPEDAIGFKEKLVAAGYDGIFVKGTTMDAGTVYHNGFQYYGTNDFYIAFDSGQIKSAAGNDGSYDASNSDITKSLEHRDGDGDGLIDDGKPSERPVVQRDPMSNENFRKWFGDSKVVNPDGTPMVVYHGTSADFHAFDDAKTGKNDRGLWGRGHYFASSPASASSYALREGEGARVIPAYVSIQNPLVLKTGADLVTRLPDGTDYRTLLGDNLDGSKIKSIAQSAGHDGVIQIKPDGTIGDVVAYSSSQIKSAISNSGNYDKRDSDIRKAGPSQLALFDEIKDGDGDGLIYDGTPQERPASSSTKKVSGEGFDQWFGDSKVVDSEGNPLVVYHGTTNDFDEFNNPYADDAGGNWHMFSEKPEYSDNFANGTGGRLLPVYLRIEKPFDLTHLPVRRGDVRNKLLDEFREAGLDVELLDKKLPHERDLYQFINRRGFRGLLMDQLKAKGYDGIKMPDAYDGPEENVEATTWIAFDGGQVKSATTNSGEYSRQDKRIHKSVVRDGDGDGKIFDGTDREQYASVKSRWKQSLADYETYTRDVFHPAADRYQQDHRAFVSGKSSVEPVQDEAVNAEWNRRFKEQLNLHREVKAIEEKMDQVDPLWRQKGVVANKDVSIAAFGDGKYKIKLGKKNIGFIAGFVDATLNGDQFTTSNTEIASESDRGKFAYQTALALIAAKYEGGTLSRKYQMSSAVQRAIQKIPGIAWDEKKEGWRLSNEAAKSFLAGAEINKAFSFGYAAEIVDRDGDGMIYDGTKFERPVRPKNTSQQPIDDRGRPVRYSDIVIAAEEPEFESTLRQRVSQEEDKQKLDLAIAGAKGLLGPRDRFGRKFRIGEIIAAAVDQDTKENLMARVSVPGQRKLLEQSIERAKSLEADKYADYVGVVAEAASQYKTYSKSKLDKAIGRWLEENAISESKVHTKLAYGVKELPSPEVVSDIAAEQQSYTNVPISPEARISYESFRNALVSQYEMILGTGLKVYPWRGEGEPYKAAPEKPWTPDSELMRKRVEDEGQFYFFMTQNGFGSSVPNQSNYHPLLEMSPCLTSSGEPMLYNDVFRVVHDLMAHIHGEYSFSTRGEFNAMLCHASTLPKEAWPALFSETFAQNAVYQQTGKYADQNTFKSKYVGIIGKQLAEKSVKKSLDVFDVFEMYGMYDQPLGYGHRKRRMFVPGSPDFAVASLKKSFNPNAIDRDGDGIVQEGTQFERPAMKPSKAQARHIDSMTDDVGPAGISKREAFDRAKGDGKGDRLTYAQSVKATMMYLGTNTSDWTATKIVGFHETTDGARDVALPQFDRPEGYSPAPAIFTNSSGDVGCCELCGHNIKNVYSIQNDSKKWLMNVGSECVTHFMEGESGAKLAKKTKDEINLDLLRSAWELHDRLNSVFGFEYDVAKSPGEKGRLLNWIDVDRYSKDRVIDQLARSKWSGVNAGQYLGHEKAEAVFEAGKKLLSMLYRKDGTPILPEAGKRMAAKIDNWRVPYRYVRSYEAATVAHVTKWAKENKGAIGEIAKLVDSVFEDQSSQINKSLANAGLMDIVDRDGDGMIYDGTKYERPAPTKAHTPVLNPIGKVTSAPGSGIVQAVSDPDVRIPIPEGFEHIDHLHVSLAARGNTTDEMRQALLNTKIEGAPAAILDKVAVIARANGRISVIASLKNQSEWKQYADKVFSKLGVSNPEPDRLFHVTIANNMGGNPQLSVSDAKPEDFDRAKSTLARLTAAHQSASSRLAEINDESSKIQAQLEGMRSESKKLDKQAVDSLAGLGLEPHEFQQQLQKKYEELGVTGIRDAIKDLAIKAKLLSQESDQLNLKLAGMREHFRLAEIANNPNFRAWFGNSVCKSSDGLPLVIYHGTADGGFEEFKDIESDKHVATYGSPDIEIAAGYSIGFQDDITPVYATKIDEVDPTKIWKLYGNEEIGWEFNTPESASAEASRLNINSPIRLRYELTSTALRSESSDVILKAYNSSLDERFVGAQGVYPLFFKMENPLVVEGNKRAWDNLGHELGDSTSEVEVAARELGYDGVIFKDIRDNGVADYTERPADVYVVFKADQIKSLHNIGTFDRSTKNILKSLNPRDGDGDGFIDDGKPTQRRVQVGDVFPEDVAGELVARWRAGDSRSKNEGRYSGPEKLNEPMQVVDFPISSFTPEYLQFISETTNADRVQTYVAEKPETPVFVAVTRDGHTIVSDGGHRLMAAVARGDDHIRAVVPLSLAKTMLGKQIADRIAREIEESPDSEAEVVLGDRVESVLDSIEWSPQDVASVVGAPDDSQVTVEYVDGALEVSVSHEHIETMVRYIRAAKGVKLSKASTSTRLYIENDVFKVAGWKDGKRTAPPGFGTAVFARQVYNCARRGISFLKCTASRNDESGIVGYSVWPKLGYTGKIEDLKSSLAARVKEKFPSARTILDVNSTAEGREWWSTHGTSFEAYFDLKEDAPSMKTLAAYQMSKERV